MTKMTRPLALMAVMAMLAGGTLTLAVAQDKAKPAQKDDKKKTDKKNKDGSIEVYKGKNGFRYRVKNSEGKTIAMPLPQMAWETKKECEEAIEDLKTTLEKGKVVEVKE